MILERERIETAIKPQVSGNRRRSRLARIGNSEVVTDIIRISATLIGSGVGVSIALNFLSHIG